ncbi:hypothetical protein FRC10_008262 [Ceratobasidium sp. 414]|nr:hypothetical protein FRC10_008262 [Ceratobasidium sp. 414]
MTHLEQQPSTAMIDPSQHAQPTPHTAVIPRTTNYDAALESAKAMFQRYFPSGSAHRFRWLSVRVQTSSGATWADFDPQSFSDVIADGGVELRLCEEADVKLDVSVLPLGHNLGTADLESYYQFKIITVGQMSVGKSMMLQYFTKKEESRLGTLPATIGPISEVTNRFMTTEGELIKATLWDTGKYT